VCLAACLASLPALVGAQSLGQAAQKERERRDKVRENGGSTKTLTEEDLATTKGTLANDPTAEPAATPTPPATKSAPASRARRLPAMDPAPPETQGEEYWRRRVAEARNRVDLAQRRHDAMQAMIRFGAAEMHDANGKRVIYSNQQLKTMADAADAELSAAQSALESVLEEGRHAGAQPGWLR